MNSSFQSLETLRRDEKVVLGKFTKIQHSNYSIIVSNSSISVYSRFKNLTNLSLSLFNNIQADFVELQLMHNLVVLVVAGYNQIREYQLFLYDLASERLLDFPYSTQPLVSSVRLSDCVVLAGANGLLYVIRHSHGLKFEEYNLGLGAISCLGLIKQSVVVASKGDLKFLKISPAGVETKVIDGLTSHDLPITFVKSHNNYLLVGVGDKDSLSAVLLVYKLRGDDFTLLGKIKGEHASFLKTVCINSVPQSSNILVYSVFENLGESFSLTVHGIEADDSIYFIKSELIELTESESILDIRDNVHEALILTPAGWFSYAALQPSIKLDVNVFEMIKNKFFPNYSPTSQGNCVFFSKLLKVMNLETANQSPKDHKEFEGLYEQIKAIKVDKLKRMCLVYYLFLNLINEDMNNEEKRTEFCEEAMIPFNFKLLIEGYWNLDNNLFEEGFASFMNPSVEPNFLIDILKYFYRSEKYEYGYLMYKAFHCNYQNYSEFILHLILKNGQVTEALSLCDCSRTLFDQFLAYCFQENFEKQLLGLSFTPNQEASLITYCEKYSLDFLFLYHAQRGYYLEAALYYYQYLLHKNDSRLGLIYQHIVQSMPAPMLKTFEIRKNEKGETVLSTCIPLVSSNLKDNQMSTLIQAIPSLYTRKPIYDEKRYQEQRLLYVNDIDRDKAIPIEDMQGLEIEEEKTLKRSSSKARSLQSICNVNKPLQVLKPSISPFSPNKQFGTEIPYTRTSATRQLQLTAENAVAATIKRVPAAFSMLKKVTNSLQGKPPKATDEEKPKRRTKKEDPAPMTPTRSSARLKARLAASANSSAQNSGRSTPVMEEVSTPKSRKRKEEDKPDKSDKDKVSLSDKVTVTASDKVTATPISSRVANIKKSTSKSKLTPSKLTPRK